MGVLVEIMEEVFQLLVGLEKMVDLEVVEHLNAVLHHQSLEVVEIHLLQVLLKDKMEEVVKVILVAVEVALVLPVKLPPVLEKLVMVEQVCLQVLTLQIVLEHQDPHQEDFLQVVVEVITKHQVLHLFKEQVVSVVEVLEMFQEVLVMQE